MSGRGLDAFATPGLSLSGGKPATSWCRPGLGVPRPEPFLVYEKLIAMANKAPSAGVGVFGGSGVYKLLDDVGLVDVSTPYGQPTDPIAIGTAAGRPGAVFPPPGSEHTHPPGAGQHRPHPWA